MAEKEQMGFWRVARWWGGLFLALCLAGMAVPMAFAKGGAIACEGVTVPTTRPAMSGSGWGTYCVPCVLANRTFGRVPVIETLEAALTSAATEHPGTRFLYGEIGLPSGGPFPPHRTHREGLSVDIMVPLSDGAVLPTNALNRFGYDVEFDDAGEGKAGRIDFEALGALILALADEAEARGGAVRRIFFAPDLQPELMETRAGALLRDRIAFNARQSWVRHDDHIHVDFTFPCTGES